MTEEVGASAKAVSLPVQGMPFGALLDAKHKRLKVTLR